MFKLSNAYLIALILSVACQPPEKQKKAPNIILIMGDDMGYSDIGAYGGEINTPNLDTLAQNGLRFTQFYNTARCCPTRASLLTGLYPQQTGIGHMVRDRGTPAYQGDLNKQAVTIAEVLKSSGYSTYMSGKWHITPYVPENPDKKNWPIQRGFDQFFGMISGAGSFYDPRSLTENNDYVAPRDGFYATTDFTNHAVKYIKEHQEENPYFIYVAYTAAHWPMHAPAEEVAKYKGKYDLGWDKLREERYDRLKKMGIVKDSWPLTPRSERAVSWKDSLDDRAWEIANMEVYAAMIDIMDQGIGEIISTLKDKDELENTIIFFLQDNGACAEVLDWENPLPPEDELTEMKPGELQWRNVPQITRDGKPVKLMRDGWPGPADGYTAYGPNWANASNTPFREFKHWVHEGGIATPLIVHWPDQIKEGGKFVTDPAHLIDIMATCVDVAGAEYPENYNNYPITPLEGKSLSPLFNRQNLEERALFWEHEGNRAVRLGKWKLVSKTDGNNPYIWDKTETLSIESWELYNMDEDRTEMNNLAIENPELVAEMSNLWIKWAKRTGAIPRPVTP